MADYLMWLSVALSVAAIGCLVASFAHSREADRLRAERKALAEERKALAEERMRKVLDELTVSMGGTPPPPVPPPAREVRSDPSPIDWRFRP